MLCCLEPPLIGSRPMNLRVSGYTDTRLDLFKRRAAFLIQPAGIDSFATRQVRSKFPQPFPELAAGADEITSLAMIKSYREVDESLEKQPARAALRRPRLFQHLMALEELTVIEEQDSPLQ